MQKVPDLSCLLDAQICLNQFAILIDICTTLDLKDMLAIVPKHLEVEIAHQIVLFEPRERDKTIAYCKNSWT